MLLFNPKKSQTSTIKSHFPRLTKKHLHTRIRVVIETTEKKKLQSSDNRVKNKEVK